MLKNRRNRALRFGGGAALAGGASSAFAELPTAATTAFTELVTAVSDVETAIWPIIGAAIVAFTIIKLVKRGASKI